MLQIRNLIIILLFSAFNFIACEDNLIELKSAAHLTELAGHKKPMLIDVATSWCGPCKMMAPIIHELAQEHKNVLFVKLDGDNRSLTNHVAQTYGTQITGFPSFLLISADNKLVEKFSGSNSKSFMERKIACISIERAPHTMPRPMYKDEEYTMPIGRTMPERRPTNGMPIEVKKKAVPLAKIETLDQYCKQVAGVDKPVLIQFTTPGCVMCRHLSGLLEELQAEFPSIKFVSIDITNRSLKNVVSHEGVLAIPQYKWLYDREDMTKDPKKIDIHELRKKINKSFKLNKFDLD
jgi:thioredoxin 1